MNHTLPKHSAPRRPRGFTLIELLVVLGIIVLLLAAAVPAFNYITGSRSTDSAENQISAMLVRARATAIENKGLAGIAFFVNPRDGRATMGLVVQKTSSAQLEDDPYNQYHGWVQSSIHSGGSSSAPKYIQGQEAVSVAYDNVTKRYVVGNFTNIDTTTGGTAAAASNIPPDRNAAPPTVWGNSWWAADLSDSSRNLDFASQGDLETLPAGVAVQLINDPKGQSARDRYVQTGVILFDAQGRLTSIPYAFKNTSDIFALLQIPSATYTQWPVAPTGATPPFYSQLGLVIYDRATFLNQPNHTEGDSSLLVQGIPSLPSQSTWSLEDAEEAWLDQNTTPLFVNRYNGTLLKGQ